MPDLPKLMTDRLVLRTVERNDWPTILEIQTNTELMKHVKEILELDAIKQMHEQLLKPWKAEDDEWAMYIAQDKKTGEAIGVFSLRITSSFLSCAEIGYIILEHSQGKGFASEGAKLVKQYLFETLNIRRVVAICNAENTGSWKVMENIGLKREAFHRLDHRIKDTWYDSYIYAQLNPTLNLDD